MYDEYERICLDLTPFVTYANIAVRLYGRVAQKQSWLWLSTHSLAHSLTHCYKCKMAVVRAPLSSYAIADWLRTVYV